MDHESINALKIAGYMFIVGGFGILTTGALMMYFGTILLRGKP